MIYDIKMYVLPLLMLFRRALYIRHLIEAPLMVQWQILQL